MKNMTSLIENKTKKKLHYYNLPKWMKKSTYVKIFFVWLGMWSYQDKMDIDQEEAGLERAEFYPVEVKYDEDADVDESEESDDLHNMSQEWIIVSSHLSLCPSVCLCERLRRSVGSIYLSV